MSAWKPKRFWKKACVIKLNSGFGIATDGRMHKTPQGRALELPTRELAQLLADELNGIRDEIDWNELPFTALGASAVDMTAETKKALFSKIAEYGGSDLLCYRAADSDELAARQAEAWDPMLDWAERTYGLKLNCGKGVMPITQPESSLDRLHRHLAEMGPFNLTALNVLTGLAGSTVIGLGALCQVAPPGALWKMSRIDEDWQRELWGSAEGDKEDAAMREKAFADAFEFSSAAGCRHNSAL